MNTPVEFSLKQVSLLDKYRANAGTVYMTGTQALVRLPMIQRVRDQVAGLNTAGYISGYRGSPVGGYDQALWRAREDLDAHHIRFVAGTNEDLAATAIWGTQQLNSFPGAQYDGVFGIWYGKGPGVDRSGDVLRHANQAGSSRFGGVLAVGGDDHGAKSSTMAAQTDHIFMAVCMPILAPATLQDYIDLGLHGFALSRFSGLWVGFKAVTDTIETAGIVDVSSDRLRVQLPEGLALPAGGLNLRWPEETFLQLEERLVRHKLPAALAYARANRLNRTVFGRPEGEPARLGLVSSGKAYLDLMQALSDLGIDDATARRLGLRVFKVDMVWPLEPTTAAQFCAGCERVLVIEEKRSIIEAQLRDILYASSDRPTVVGKRDEHGQALLPEYGELSPAMISRLLADQLRRMSERADDRYGSRDTVALERIGARLTELDAREVRARRTFEVIERIPYFCSGCPHNSSTKVPEGSRAMAGIGCHYMVQWMDRSTATFTHMGGEGMTWVGQAPFSQTKHVFQNLGDGTYFHSGYLAIRHALATGTRMTYKILFNDAVAMTGGQRHDGQLTPAAIARQVKAEGVRKIVVVTDEPDKYPSGYFDADVAVHHRQQLDEVQRELRDFDGLSVLIYDQTCAAEKRRRRKRGDFADPARRAFINTAVCEGCGDCGKQSNCVSIEPVETELGRKRQINQSSCNKDFSCQTGFCPSFVSVVGGQLRKASSADSPAARPVDIRLTEPPRAAIAPTYSLLVTGIGGTGVVTIGQILGMAAHLEGKAVTVMDMAGLAQKNGAVMSCVRFAHDVRDLHAPRIGVAAADAVIGGDIVVTASRDSLLKYRHGITRVVANVCSVPTADFTRDPNWRFPLGSMEAAIVDAVGEHRSWFIDASTLATRLLGDTIAGNLFMLGYACQHGLLPVSVSAIERAIELNDVAVEFNLAAFNWGRRAAVDAAQVMVAAGLDPLVTSEVPVSAVGLPGRQSAATGESAVVKAGARAPSAATDSIKALLSDRSRRLEQYQDRAYAQRYRSAVERLLKAERAMPGHDSGLPLSCAAARNFFKLMAYKDEYEVARLHSDPAFRAALEQQFEGAVTLRYHLAPPLFARRNNQGELVKAEFGPWMGTAMRFLAGFKRLRGTALDPFGYSDERRTERDLLAQYESQMQVWSERLSAKNYQLAIDWAGLPELIRGFGHVKAASVQRYREREQALQVKIER